jgi:hypothetical protein
MHLALKLSFRSKADGPEKTAPATHNPKAGGICLRLSGEPSRKAKAGQVVWLSPFPCLMDRSGPQPSELVSPLITLLLADRFTLRKQVEVVRAAGL